MKLLQSIKNFFAPHQPKQEPVVLVTPTPLVEVETVMTVQPIEQVKVSPAKDWPAVETAPIREDVKASAAAAWPFPTAPKPKAEKAPVKAKKTTPAKIAVAPTKAKAAGQKPKNKAVTKGSKK